MIDDIEFTNNWTHSAPTGTSLNGEEIVWEDIDTPNIQSVIDVGIVITRSYSSSPMCSPSRFSLLTGRQAMRSEYNLLSTTQDWQNGPTVNVPNSRLYGENDDRYNIPYVLQTYGYYTGMVGKWHLASADDNGNDFGASCTWQAPNETLYDQCRNMIKDQGFDMVDAYYHSNIKTNDEYSHNPEWMVDISTKFMDTAVSESKPFFLYFSATLTHKPKIKTALKSFTKEDTPKGTLTGDDIPQTTMKTRNKIWDEAVDYGYGGNNIITSKIAGVLWMDDAIGALLKHLTDKRLANNTFIVIMSDHGQIAKGSLYEMGTRIVQFVKFPNYWNNSVTPYYTPNDFITSNVDIAPVIYDIVGIENETQTGVIDGQSWIDDVFDQMSEIDGSACCESRFMDIDNSHAMVHGDWAYIYRATDGDTNSYYPYAMDREQIYDLSSDASQQSNDIDNPEIANEVYWFRLEMHDYISERCPIAQCNTPMQTCTTYTTAECSRTQRCDDGDEELSSHQCADSLRYKYECLHCDWISENEIFASNAELRSYHPDSVRRNIITNDEHKTIFFTANNAYYLLVILLLVNIILIISNGLYYKYEMVKTYKN